MLSKKIDRPQILVSLNSTYVPTGQCDCDGGDCACDLSPLTELTSDFRLSQGILDTEFVRVPNSQMMNLDDTYFICFGTYHQVAVLNQSAIFLLEQFTNPQKLDDIAIEHLDIDPIDLQAAIQELYQARLIAPNNYSSFNLNEIPETLTAWLHITDRCNLRCDYCYLPHEAKDMSIDIGKAAIESTFRSATLNNYRRVKLKYAGGEALLCSPLIKDLHLYAQSLSKETDIILDGVVLSNGTLITPEIVEMLQILNLRLMISLDGLSNFHNMQRSYASGKGSFEDVERGIKIALKNGIIPDVSITVSGRNAEGLPDLLEWILEYNLPFSLNFYRENELSASYEDLQLEESRLIEGMLAAFKVIELKLPNRSLLGSLIDRANLASSHKRTCGVGQSYLVFDYKGQIAKCQMQLHKTISASKTQDPLTLVRQDKAGIQNLSVEEKEGCRTCEWKYWCTGGCSLATFKATGRYDIQSPNCNIYKALYPEALRLEGLRLIKYSSPTKS
ncbi:radical SAM/SPASM domain-containing protein [Nostoc sp. 'Peltigera malacea cyanobiont' DB3992]|uniref:radical SAM/SPASM domain-containing protein n=1 Tax=Nostoc sp. 'Peltigera malacea cyanobiont' DB3992 TaxID=1206980 RepID=UPI000C051B7E|nr:radical SAM protein [Nostoc sp. 'Peltigera malacea cyanobiont' DB3992]PHM08796.1 radical SAM protein [Nostoc sp. 'Peltigera malacea cyanobiont' DB3992]